MSFDTTNLRRGLAASLLTLPLLAGVAHAQSANGQTTVQTPPNSMQGNSLGSNGTGMNAQTSGNAVGPGAMGRSMPDLNMSRTSITKAGNAMRNVMAINKTYSARLTAANSPAARQQIVATAKQKAVEAIHRQGLTTSQYNQVLASARSNPTLRQQLLSRAGVSAND